MPNMSRSKGQRGEREVCHILSHGLGFEVTRELEAPRSGGCDIVITIADITYMIEVKLHIKFTEKQITEYWLQAIRQAEESRHRILNPIPILIYRQNRWLKWACRMSWEHMLWQLQATKIKKKNISEEKDYVTLEIDKAIDIMDITRTTNPSISQGTMGIRKGLGEHEDETETRNG